MDKQEFATLIDMYGADTNRWPAPLREPARQLLARNPRLASEARALDQLLDGYVPAAAGNDFLEQIATQAQASQPQPQMLFYFYRRRPMALAATWAACAVIGFFAGSLNVSKTSNIQVASTQLVTTQATDKSGSSSDTSIDKGIFGATQLNEVWL